MYEWTHKGVCVWDCVPKYVSMQISRGLLSVTWLAEGIHLWLINILKHIKELLPLTHRHRRMFDGLLP